MLAFSSVGVCFNRKERELLRRNEKEQKIVKSANCIILVIPESVCVSCNVFSFHVRADMHV